MNGYASSKGYHRQMKIRSFTLGKSIPDLECLVSLGSKGRSFGHYAEQYFPQYNPVEKYRNC